MRSTLRLLCGCSRSAVTAEAATVGVGVGAGAGAADMHGPLGPAAWQPLSKLVTRIRFSFTLLLNCNSFALLFLHILRAHTRIHTCNRRVCVCVFECEASRAVSVPSRRRKQKSLSVHIYCETRWTTPDQCAHPPPTPPSPPSLQFPCPVQTRLDLR